MTDGRVTRRRMLASLGTAGSVGIAGCSSGDSTETSTETNQPPLDADSTENATEPRTTSQDATSETIHVSTDGSDDDPGTEDEPLSSIQTAVERVESGQTIYVHPGEYFEYVEFRDGGEPNAPVTLTGPPDAVLKPPEGIDHQVISVDASHVHITGLTITGLYDEDNPEAPESYHPGKLVALNSFPEDGDDYIEGLVVSPHRIGNAGQSLINSQMLRDCEIGGFEVIGPAGARWIFDDGVDDHNGEIVYLGTAGDNRLERGFEGYDRSRNIRVHHIDNSAGHPHSELVDCKGGIQDVTVEYCTDGGGAQSDDSYHSQSINLAAHQCTVRWNVIRDAEGSGIEIGPTAYMNDLDFLGEPQTDLEQRMGMDNSIYDNVFTGNASDAVDFFRESHLPGDDVNPLPEDQRVFCGNLFDGYSDGAPERPCPSNIPSGEGVGHLGGDSPWDGEAPTKEAVFSRHATAKNLDATVEADSVPTDTDIEATVTLTNEGESPEEIVLRLRIREHVLATETISIPAGETRETRLTTSGIPNPEEVAITRNGQKIGYVRVTDDG